MKLMKVMKTMKTIIRTYSELITLPTFMERYKYLRIGGTVGTDSTGPQAFPQGRQDGVDPGHHERHEKLRRADGQQQPAMFFCDAHGQP